MKKRRITALLLALTMLALTACSSGSGGGGSSSGNSDTTHRLAFGGNNSSTSSYIISVAYGEIINTNVPGASMTVEETGGGFEVITQLINGELDGCCASDAAAYDAINKTGQFADVDNSDNFYAWLPMYTSPVQAIVKADSPITCFSDFEGKRIGMDVVGTGSETIHTRMFEVFGMSDKITAVNVSKAESMEMLKTGELDVAIITTAAPTTTIVEFGTTEKYRIIPFTAEEISQMAGPGSYMIPTVLSASTYDQLTEDVSTVCLYTNAYVGKNLDDELVYNMTKAVWEHQDRLISAHPSQELLSPEMVKGVLQVNQYHPGAAKYYQEMGWID